MSAHESTRVPRAMRRTFAWVMPSDFAWEYALPVWPSVTPDAGGPMHPDVVAVHDATLLAERRLQARRQEPDGS